MPRAVDPFLFGQQLPITHSPLNRIAHSVRKPDFTPEDLTEQFETFIRDFLCPAIEEMTGIDMSGLMELLDLLALDFSSPTAFFESLINSILALPEIVLLLVNAVIEQLFALPETFAALFSAVIELLLSLPDLIMQLLTGLLNTLEDLTGINLIPFLEIWTGIDISSPTAFLASLANAIVATGLALLGPDSPLNAMNLFGSIAPNLFGAIPIGALTDALPNLFGFGSDFPLGSIADGPDWIVDTLVGAVTGGFSAKILANGQTHGLRSIPIAVAPGQVLDLSVLTKWTGLSATGSPINFGVIAYQKGNEIARTVLASIVSPGAASSGWQTLAAPFTVPAGIDTIKLRLGLGSTATAGTVHFASVIGNQPGKIIQGWVKDLPEQFAGILDILGLGALGDLILPNIEAVWNHLIDTIINPLGTIRDVLAQINIQEIINIIIQAVEGIPIIGGTLAEAFESMTEIFDTALDGQALGTDALGQIDDLLSDLLTIPATIIGALPQSKITSLVTDLTDRLKISGVNGSNDYWTNLYGAFKGQSGGAAGGTAVNLLSQFHSMLVSINGSSVTSLVSLDTRSTELTQTMQILANQVVTPITSLISNVKNWWDAEDWIWW